MKYLAGFGQFWYDFIVGDDWTVAAGVVIALGLTALLERSALAAWWLMPLAVAIVLFASVWRATRK